VSVLPRGAALFGGKLLTTGTAQEQRWPLLLYGLTGAAVTIAVAYGLSRAAEWARKTFFVMALAQLFIAVLRVGGIGLHLAAVGLRGMGGYLTGLMNGRNLRRTRCWERSLPRG
jgi:hypothetical protein